jgi:hypothetical protein
LDGFALSVLVGDFLGRAAGVLLAARALRARAHLWRADTRAWCAHGLRRHTACELRSRAAAATAANDAAPARRSAAPTTGDVRE